MSQISEEKSLAAYHAFQSGESPTFTKACKAQRVCIKFASKFLRERFGITITRDRFWKKYIGMNHRFFENIQSEAAAYFLGMLSADGSIERDGNRVSWTILEGDVAVMARFLEEVGLPVDLFKEFSIPGSQPMRRLEIFSRQMRNDLIQKGLVPNKSNEDFGPYREIAPELRHHYFRGLFDGDGWFSLSGKLPEIGLCNTKSICEYVKSVLDEEGITGSNAVTRNNTAKENQLHRVRIGSRQKILAVIDYLYRDATIFIDRKRDACLQFIQQCSALSI